MDDTLIPGGCTRYIQGPDVSWNKPFKARCTEQYDDWLSEVGMYELTEAAGNLKAPPRRKIVQWKLKDRDNQMFSCVWAEFTNRWFKR